MKSRTALISGVTGQDGILLARELRRAGYQVIGTRLPHSSADRLVYLDGVDVVPLDLRDATGWADLIEQANPDLFFHLAAITSVAESWHHPELTAEINATATARLVESIGQLSPNARTFVASSAEVFGPDAPVPQTELSPMDLKSPYATSKAAVRNLASRARDRGQFVSTGLLYPHESVLRPLQFVTRKITSAAAEISLGQRERLSLGNIDVARDWGAASDVVAAMQAIVQAPSPDEFIVATGTVTALREIVEIAFAAAQVSDPWDRIGTDEHLLRPSDPAVLVGDSSRLRERTGWFPDQPISAVIESMVAADVRRLRSGRTELADLLD